MHHREMTQEELRKTFDEALLDDRADLQLEDLQTSGVLADTFPEVSSMVGFGGARQGHKDLWGHTKQVVRQCVPKVEVRWAALFHDVGKVKTFSRDSGKVTFHGHEVVSARMFDGAARRSKLFSAEQRKHIRFLVRHLGHVEAYASDWTDSAVRRLNRDLGALFVDTVLLARADITTRHDHKRRRHHERMNELVERAEEIAAADAVVPPLPKGMGDALMKALDLTPGRRIGELKKALEAAVEEGAVEPHLEAEHYVEFVKSNPERFNS